MASLSCSANHCTYNSEKLCCKGDIMVGGKEACCKSETCCESFAVKREGADAYKSATVHPSKVISVDCEAAKCIYNSNYKCVAEHVDIKGEGVNESRETACMTFQEK